MNLIPFSTLPNRSGLIASNLEINRSDAGQNIRNTRANYIY